MTDWTWAYDDDPAGGSPVFPTQAEAEAWLAESWQDLTDDGVRAVTLRAGEFVVYGPMSLSQN